MLKTISFFGTCSARSELSLCSQRIARKFTVKRVQVEFADGVNDLMEIKLFATNSNHTPTTGEPDGTSLLSEHGQVDYVVGDGMQKDFEHEVVVNQRGTYIQVYANNKDYFEHDVIALVTIDSDGEEEGK